MQELALHLLDIIQNSIRAEASCVRLKIIEKPSENLLAFEIEDDGRGMSTEFVSKVTNPFTTTRTLRKVGLGLPFLKQMCEECEGKLDIISTEGKGTTIQAHLMYNHIDRLPLGDVASTLVTLIMGKPEVRYCYKHVYETKEFSFDTDEIKETLEGVPIENVHILKWIEEFVKNQLEVLYKD